MAQTLTRVTRTVTTDLTVLSTVSTAETGLAALMAVLDNLNDMQLKALTIIGVAQYLKLTLSGTDYTANYQSLKDQAITLLGSIDPMQERQLALLECALACNASMYAQSVTTLNVNTLLSTAETGDLNISSLPELNRMLALLRFKGGT